MRRSEEPVGGGSARWLNGPHGCCYVSHYVTDPLTRSRYGKTKSTITLNMPRYPVGILLTTRMLLKAAHCRASTRFASAPKHTFVVGLEGGAHANSCKLPKPTIFPVTFSPTCCRYRGAAGTKQSSSSVSFCPNISTLGSRFTFQQQQQLVSSRLVSTLDAR